MRSVNPYSLALFCPRYSFYGPQEGMERKVWNRKCGTAIVEQQMWNCKCGTANVKQQMWNSKCGTANVEQQMWNSKCIKQKIF